MALRFRPNRAARRILARRHKLTVRVKMTLTLAHQAPITRFRTITLTAPARRPNARVLRARAGRLCRRHNSHATRICARF